MLGSIYIGLSGMNAYSQGLQTISNNVANLNSPGFKGTSVSFTDMYSSGGGGLTFLKGSDASHAGGGVRVADPKIDFSGGDLRQSEGDLDLAIQGSGFLVLLDGDKTFYARTGRFVVGNDGFITQEGTSYRLAMLNASGQAVALNVDQKRTNPPAATTTVKLAGNLSSGSGSSGSTATVPDVTVYDSRGGKHILQVKLTKVPNTTDEWSYTVTDDKDTEIGKSTLKFLGGASVDPLTSKLTLEVGPDGAKTSVVLDFSTGVTSFSSLNTLGVLSSDGNAPGNNPRVSVEDGKIKITYSNQKSEFLGDIALADFRNPQQLERAGDGLFINRGDGQFRLGRSEADGVGKLESRRIEASNVDLSAQFGDLILIQRGFQASSQVVSVSNDMIQQLFGIRGQG